MHAADLFDARNHDIVEFIHIFHQPFGVFAASHLHLQAGFEDFSLRGSPVLQFIGIEFQAVVLDLMDDGSYAFLGRSGKGEDDGSGADWGQAGADSFQAEQDDGRAEDSGCIHARAAGQADGGSHPQSGGRSESAYHVALEDDGACSQEADARNNLGGHAGRVFQVESESVLRDDAEEGTSDGYQEVGAEAGFFRTVLTLQTDDSAQQQSNEESEGGFYQFVHGLFFLNNNAFVDRLFGFLGFNPYFCLSGNWATTDERMLEVPA